MLRAKKGKELRVVKECCADVFVEAQKPGRALLHQVNCIGVMGAGVAGQVRRRWPECYDAYKRVCSKDMLGHVFLYDDAVKIFNAFGQLGISRTKQVTDYAAWRSILRSLIAYLDSAKANGKELTIVAPYGIGCGLGGGNWQIMHKMLSDAFVAHELILCKNCRIL